MKKINHQGQCLKAGLSFPLDIPLVLKKNYEELIKNNKLRLKTQQRLKNESHNVFTKEINKIALSSNDYKRIQSIDSIETY